MQQPIVARINNLGASTRYGALMGASSAATDELYFYQVIPTAGTLSDFRIELTVAPGAGTSYTFTLRVNGAPSTVTVTISNTDTTGSDIAHSVAVSAGDTVSIQVANSGAVADSQARVCTNFTGDTAGESILLSYWGTAHNINTYYGSVCGHNITWATVTEADWKQIIPTSGTLKKLYVRLSADPGDAPDGFTITLRKNGASQALTTTIVANDTTGNDTAHTVAVAAGDDVTMMVEPINTPGTPNVMFGMVFVSDTDGESLLLGGSSDDLSASGTEYNWYSNQYGSYWSATESVRDNIINACTLKKLYVELSGTPENGGGADDKYTFTVRSEAGATDLTCEIANLDTTGNDTSNEHVIADGETLSLQCVPSSTPTVRDAYWGLVAYLEPPSASASPSVSESASPSVSESASPSSTPSVSESLSPSVSESVSPSASPSPSVSESASPSSTPSVSESVSPSVSESASPSSTPSVSESASPSSTPSVSESTSPSVSESASPSVSESTSPSSTPSVSESVSPSASPSASVSESASPSVTPSDSPSSTPSVSVSSTPSVSPSSSISTSPSPSSTPSASASPSPSSSLSASPSGSTSVSASNSYGDCTLTAKKGSLFITGAGSLSLTAERATISITPAVTSFGDFAKAAKKATLVISPGVSSYGSFAQEAKKATLALTGFELSSGTFDNAAKKARLVIIPSKETYECIVMCLSNTANTTYSNYEFNSLTQYGDTILAANSSGIFTLSGTTDNGTEIDVTLVTPEDDFGSSHIKVIPEAVISMEGGPVQITLNEGQPQKATYTDEFKNRRVKFGKGEERKRYNKITIESIDGADFKMDAIELIPFEIQRKSRNTGLDYES